MEVTNALKNIVEKKISRLDRYFNPNVEGHVTLSVQKTRQSIDRQTIEVSIPFNGVTLRCEEATDDMYVSLDLVVDKLERKIRKQKTKLERRFHEGSLKTQFISTFVEEEEDGGSEEGVVVRTKRFAVKPMSTEEAVLQMDLLGHNFFVFRSYDGDVNVVYKRKDGNYGLIEPEF
jgi:putative sigma-54 modulation protein